jgi:hypothetical protein
MFVNITYPTSISASIMGAEWESLKTIGHFINFLIHPSLIFQSMWNFTVIYSYWILLAIAMLSSIFYVLGFKKCAKYIPGSIALYVLIQMLKKVL